MEETSEFFSGENPILVYILTAEPESHRAQILAKSFDNDIFNIQLTSIDVPKNLSYEGIEKKDSEEIYRFKYILEDSLNETDGLVVIIKDNLVVNDTPETLQEKIVAMSKMQDIDIGYLHRYNDDCRDYLKGKIKGIISIADKPGKITRGKDPHGSDALLITPRGREILLSKRSSRGGERIIYEKSLSYTLNKLVKKGELISSVSLSNIFNYDISNSTNPKDFEKTNECRPFSFFEKDENRTKYSKANTDINIDKIEDIIKNNVNDATRSNSSSLFWILIILIVFFIIFFLYKRNKEKTSSNMEESWYKNSGTEEIKL